MSLKDLKIEATESTPYISCKGNEGVIEFKGRSIPENATSFYTPVIDWLEEYGKTPGNQTMLEFYMEYINSISQKIILDILYRVEDLKKQNGNQVNVVWRYEKDDEEMEDEGRLFASKVDLDFEMISEN